MMLREIEYENASTERKPSLSFDPNVGDSPTSGRIVVGFAVIEKSAAVWPRCWPHSNLQHWFR